MRYRRGYRARRRRFSGKRGRAITYGQIGRKIYNDVKWLKSVVNVEKKYFDTSGSAGYSSTGSTATLVNMSIGDGAVNRDGQSVKVVSSFLNGYAQINTSATRSIVRIMLVLDTQPNAAAAAITDVLVSATPESPMLIGNASRFKVIRDFRITLSINGSEIVYFKKYTKCGFHVKYNTGTSGTVADITTNNLFYIILSNEATNTPVVAWYHRTRFIDN